jgi:hypothetical protein
MSSIHPFAVFILFVVLLGPVQSTQQHGRSSNLFPVKQVYQFPNKTWVENLAVLRNGSILATVMTVPQLYLIDPFKSSAVLVHEFPGYLGLLGIVETAGDVFAVITGNFSLEEVKSYPGTYAVWSVDMSDALPTISKIADVPGASFLNGMDFLGPSQDAVLMSDSTLGVVFRLDLATGEASMAIDDALMHKCSPDVLEGINGLKIHDGYMYFSNAYCGFLARVPITTSGSPAGAAEILAYTDDPKLYIYDDFAIDVDGVVYVAQGNKNVVTKVFPARRGSSGANLWHTEDIAGNLNSTEIAEPTGGRFGRTTKDKNTVYFSTGGGIGDPINGTVTVGGQIIAIDLDHKY